METLAKLLEAARTTGVQITSIVILGAVAITVTKTKRLPAWFIILIVVASIVILIIFYFSPPHISKDQKDKEKAGGIKVKRRKEIKLLPRTKNKNY
jgi:hypothetical protein